STTTIYRRSGGVTFASSPRSYQQKLNKKMYRSAMRSILSELVRGDRLVVMESFGFSEAKTKLLVDALGGLGVDCRIQNVLLVLSEVNDAVRLASRNLEKVEVLSVKNVNPVSLVRSDKVLFEIDALKQLEGALT
ncbi:MAG TPA: 50S ribosomal protein L4, partial [Gammaproteobacteria bacterium]|nr:50S ribosomal protein L4 [Gammaproteobacteria bacterium]